MQQIKTLEKVFRLERGQEMELKVTESYQDGMPVIELRGRLDAVTSESFLGTILDKIEKTQEDLILDCRELEFVSSAGLRVFLTAQKALQAKGCQLRLTNVADVIMKILVMTGFDKFLRIDA